MSGQLPSGLEQSFLVAAGELGMCSAAWLYVRQVWQAGGDVLVNELRDALGRAFPVLDAVAAAWQGGRHQPGIDPAAALAACAGAQRVVVVGIEAAFLDALLPRLDGGVRCALVRRSVFELDWERVLSNFGGRLEQVDMDGFQRWSGPRSVLLTFVYGAQGHSTHVLPSWLRVCGDDVRTQFRSLVGWDVLRSPMFVYPRRLIEVQSGSFTHLV